MDAGTETGVEIFRRGENHVGNQHMATLAQMMIDAAYPPG
jgi:hypothetical protein